MSTTLIASGAGWPEPAILDGVTPVATLVVRHDDVTVADLPTLFDADYPRVAEAATDADLPLVGPALACFRGDLTGRFAIEIGFPVVAAANAGAGIESSHLPGGRVAVLTHTGPYDQLPEAWGRLMAFLAEQGVEPAEPCGEVYVTDPTPSTDPATLRTDLFIALR